MYNNRKVKISISRCYDYYILTPNNPQIHQHIKSRAIKLYNIGKYFYDFRVGKDFINVL